MRRAAWSVVPVWLLAIGAVLVVALTPAKDAYLLWLSAACAATVIVALALQLATREPEGYVARATAAVGGALAVFAIGTLVIWLASL